MKSQATYKVNMPHFESLSFTLNNENIVNFDNSGDVSFKGLAFSGDAVERYVGMLAIDLTNAKLMNSEVTLLWNHDDRALPVGRATVSIDNEINITSGVIYNDANIPNASGIASLIKKGHPIQLSIGVSGTLSIFESRGQKFINGKNQDVNAILTNIELQEISFVNMPADSNTYINKMNKQSSKNQPITLNKEAVAMSESVTVELLKANAEIEQLKQANITLQKEKETQEQASKISQVKLAFSKFNLSDGLIADIALMSEAGQKAMLEREEANLTFRAGSLQAIDGASDKPEQVKTFLGQKA
jgi:phage head maturation protease